MASEDGWFVRRRGLPPLAATTKMSQFPSAVESKAMCSPSGDQRGVAVAGPPIEVTCAACEPSLWHTQISGLPERSELNTTFRPSSENWGLSSLRVDGLILTGALA